MLTATIVEQLVQQQCLTQTEADLLFMHSGVTPPVTWLIQQQLVEGETLAKAIAEIVGMSHVDLDHINDDQLKLNLLPESVIRNQQVLPFYWSGEKICIALADPFRLDLLQEIQVSISKPVEWLIVAYDKLAKRIANTLHIQAQETLADDATIVQYVEKLFTDAINKRASDIHIESSSQQLRIRFRIDGILYESAQLSLHLAPRLIAHLKVLAHLDITERRLPQDGRLKITLTDHRVVDCRLSICPTVRGEKCVLRLLNTTVINLEIDNLGFTETQKAHFIQAISKPQGMILVTGPTGSGKTVTLYSALHLLNQSQVNIVSVEDPVEIELSGINQVAINPKIGLTFTKTLRAFLRQDPDIIMVGEVRDSETADIAIQAAQTGHLVLSTLHTNSAAESLTRLLNMGVPAYHIAASVSLIIAQRLVRCLCTDCKAEDKLSRQIHSFVSYQAVGCSKCQAGYKGRTAIYEVMPINAKLIKIILQHQNTQQLEQQARQDGMQLLYEHGLDKVKLGITSLAELARVTR